MDAHISRINCLVLRPPRDGNDSSGSNWGARCPSSRIFAEVRRFRLLRNCVAVIGVNEDGAGIGPEDEDAGSDPKYCCSRGSRRPRSAGGGTAGEDAGSDLRRGCTRGSPRPRSAAPLPLHLPPILRLLLPLLLPPILPLVAPAPSSPAPWPTTSPTACPSAPSAPRSIEFPGCPTCMLIKRWALGGPNF